jgi:uncharacterized protein YxjI
VQYRMKQKLFAWGDDFVIQDGTGRDAFFVDGKALALGNQLSFQDMQGHELVYIKQKLLSWGPTYEIYRDGALAAVITKQLFTFFRCTFAVDVPGPDDLIAEGNFLDLEYVFRRGDRTVATVSKQWLAWSDSYGVDIPDDEDAILLLASTVVIDMACHPDDEK